MTTRRLPLVLCALTAAVAAVLTEPAGAGPGSVRLGPVVRITTPGESTCPVEGEPDVLTTSAGTWVGYNDLHECVYKAYVFELKRVTSLQLIPAGGGAPRYVHALQPGRAREALLGDPALAPDPRTPGGVVLATLYLNDDGQVTIEVFRISPSLKVSRLPSPRLREDGNLDDKEFVATDTNRRSRYFGRVYLVWDDFHQVGLVFRAFDGRRWLDAVRLTSLPGKADVAVAPNGDVAVAYEDVGGVSVRISKDGGRTFGRAVRAITGGEPGRRDPACPLRPTVGTRQRATKAVRSTYDTAGRLHVVAAVGDRPARLNVTDPGTYPNAGVAGGGVSDVVHAVSANGTRFTARPVAREGAVTFHPAIAPTPSGGVAIAWLETGADALSQYHAYLAVVPRGSATPGSPVRLSTRPATFPSAMEAQLTSDCYGIGDYIGLATTPRGVVAAWPTTDDETTPHVDSDVLVREAYLR